MTWAHWAQVLEIMLEAYSGCVLIVSHDRAFMENVVDAMLILDGSGSVRRFAGRYSAYLKQVQAATAATHEAAAAAADEERRAASAERASSAAASNGASAALPAVRIPAARYRWRLAGRRRCARRMMGSLPFHKAFQEAHSVCRHRKSRCGAWAFEKKRSTPSWRAR